MKKEEKKNSGLFVIKDHYQREGIRMKELMEKEIYTRIISKLG